MSLLQKTYKEKIVPLLEKKIGYSHTMAVPKIEKVVMNVGVGRRTPEEQERIAHDIILIAGQKFAPRGARKSIASFKIREGQIVGYKVTLRGKRMYDFVERLVYAALPRIRDFRGIPHSAVDAFGNLTIGISEHIVFPEMAGEDIKFIFGFEITIVTNAQSQKEGRALFDAFGFPFKKA